MPAGNYEEAIERANLFDAHGQKNQAFLRERQRKRLRDKILGVTAALAFIGMIFVAAFLHSNSQEEARRLGVQASNSFLKKEFAAAISISNEIIATGSYEWYGHFYKAMAYLNLEQIEDARIETEKMASYFDPVGNLFPPKLFDFYLMLHLNQANEDEYIRQQAIRAYNSVEQVKLNDQSKPEAMEKAIQDLVSQFKSRIVEKLGKQGSELLRYMQSLK